MIFDGYQKSKQKFSFLLKNMIKNRYSFKTVVSLETIKKRILERQSQEQRADDNQEIAIKRYKTYEESTEPVLEYYKKLNLLNVVNGEQPIDEISNEISGLIDRIKG